MKKTKKAIRSIIVVILTMIMVFSSSVCAFAASDLISAETEAKAVEIAKQIEAEGIVLLENEDNIPEASKKKKILV